MTPSPWAVTPHVLGVWFPRVTLGKGHSWQPQLCSLSLSLTLLGLQMSGVPEFVRHSTVSSRFAHVEAGVRMSSFSRPSLIEVKRLLPVSPFFKLTASCLHRGTGSWWAQTSSLHYTPDHTLGQYSRPLSRGLMSGDALSASSHIKTLKLPCVGWVHFAYGHGIKTGFSLNNSGSQQQPVALKESFAVDEIVRSCVWVADSI